LCGREGKGGEKERKKERTSKGCLVRHQCTWFILNDLELYPHPSGI
jgi:hypothetical protein